METRISFERMNSMTFWSRYDPIRQPKGNTDHWSKFRQRTGAPMGPNVRPNDMMDGLGGRVSVDYMETRPRNGINKSLIHNSYNDRAKEGFRYWLIDRPKPTSFGKYGMGSYKTVLGIGNAPRT